MKIMKAKTKMKTKMIVAVLRRNHQRRYKKNQHQRRYEKNQLTTKVKGGWEEDVRDDA